MNILLRRLPLVLAVLALAVGSPLVGAQETPTIVQAEYFIDQDPGEGAGFPLLPGDGAFDSAEEVLDGEVSLPATLFPGYHRLFVRMKSSVGVWGTARPIPFLLTAELSITAAEYFFDTDPGEGQGYPLDLSNVPTDSRLQFLDGANIDTSALAPGFHLLFVRARDSMGRWGPPRASTFAVQAPPKVAAAEYCILSTQGPPPAEAVWTPLNANDGSFDHTEEALNVEVDTRDLPAGQYTVWVRAYDTDNRPSRLEDMASAPLIVANAPPRFAMAADRLLAGGGTLDTALAVLHADGAVQSLVFALGPDAPPGASLDPVTGRLVWTLPPGTSTNTLRIQVSDQTSPGSVDDLLLTVFGDDPGQATPLAVASAGALAGAQSLGLRFNRPLEALSAQDPQSYVVAGQQPLTAVLQPDGRTVLLTFASLLPAPVEGTVLNVRDALGRLPAGPLAFAAEVSPLSGVVLGTGADPVEPGFEVPFGAGHLALMAGGSSFDDTADHGRFVQEVWTGDFDVRVQVGRLAPVTFATRAGLMVRESLEAGAPAVGLYLRTGEAGPRVVAAWRTTANSLVRMGAEVAALGAVPDTWLRLLRVGDTFEFYQGANGSSWSLVLATNLPLAATVRLGLAACSQDNAPGQTTTAEFRSYGFLSPAVASHPQSQSVVSGAAEVTFAVDARGLAPLSYAWYFNGSALVGQTHPTLVLPSVTVAQVGDYRVVVANGLGAVTSQVATLTVDGVGEGGFEADLMPRPAGDNVVGLSDWVMAGRLMARLEVARTQSEFQRADCAPRASRGDGQLTVLDWVQAGRYAAGLDGLTQAEGPLGAGLGGGRWAPPPPEGVGGRWVVLEGSWARPAGWAQVSVRLAGTGVENALGLSLVFDPARLQFQRAELAPGLEGVWLQVNAQAAGEGRVGLALASSPGQALGTGEMELVRVLFGVGEAVGEAAVGVGDDPLRREVVDVEAGTLPSEWVGATVVVGAPTGQVRWQVAPGGGVRWSYLGEAGVEYLIEQSTDLNRWSPVARLQSATGLVQWSDPEQAAQPNRFFRVVRTP